MGTVAILRAVSPDEPIRGLPLGSSSPRIRIRPPLSAQTEGRLSGKGHGDTGFAGRGRCPRRSVPVRAERSAPHRSTAAMSAAVVRRTARVPRIRCAGGHRPFGAGNTPRTRRHPPSPVGSRRAGPPVPRTGSPSASSPDRRSPRRLPAGGKRGTSRRTPRTPSDPRALFPGLRSSTAATSRRPSCRRRPGLRTRGASTRRCRATVRFRRGPRGARTVRLLRRDLSVGRMLERPDVEFDPGAEVDLDPTAEFGRQQRIESKGDHAGPRPVQLFPRGEVSER